MASLRMSPAAALSPETDGPTCGCAIINGNALPMDATAEPEISAAQLEALFRMEEDFDALRCGLSESEREFAEADDLAELFARESGA